MKVLGTTIECYRGETFVIRMPIVDQEGKPFIVRPNDLNPHIKLSVSSNLYKIDGRYEKNYWLDLAKIKRYKGYELKNTDNISQLDKDIVYYEITENGREYYVIDNDILKEYAFIYSKEFKNFDTKNWIAQIYKYSLSYTCGLKMNDWLKSVYLSLYGKVYDNMSNETLAHYICKKEPDLLIGVNITDPIVSYTKNIVLHGPSKLIVKEN